MVVKVVFVFENVLIERVKSDEFFEFFYLCNNNRVNSIETG